MSDPVVQAFEDQIGELTDKLENIREAVHSRTLALDKCHKKCNRLSAQLTTANSASTELLKRRDIALSVLKLAYRKHVMGDDSIGWSELEDKISDCLSSIMDIDEYTEWEASLTQAGGQ